MPSLYDTALNALARRDHSEKELARKLREKGGNQEEISQTLTHLKETGLLSDARFAQSRIRYRREISKWGDTRIRQELSAKGIPSSLAEEAFAALAEDTPPNPLETAISLLSRRSMGSPPGELSPQEQRQWFQKEKNRHLGFLLRRGFPMGVAMEAVQHTYPTPGNSSYE